MSNTKETLKQTILKLADASAKGAAAKARMRILKPAINGDAELMDAYYEAGVEMSLASLKSMTSCVGGWIHWNTQSKRYSMLDPNPTLSYIDS